MLGVDFSSVETITNAIESNDMDRARDALEKRITHEGTAAYINEKFGLSLNRTQGKAINHGFDKGESPYNLARTLFKTERPSRQQVLGCQTIFLGMLDKYPKSAKFRDELWEKARENPLVVQNSFGRRLLCFSRAKYGESGEKFAKHDQAKKYWCSCSECGPRRDRWKYAIAFLGRSAAFDALLRKMELIWYEKRLDEFSLPYLEVHDELDFSVPRDKVEHYAKIAKATFEEPIPELGGISLPASVVWGSSWAEAH
jgi:DNA polymerase I-like protein with 3'-5' exonuclease and polymerase domains